MVVVESVNPSSLLGTSRRCLHNLHFGQRILISSMQVYPIDLETLWTDVSKVKLDAISVAKSLNLDTQKELAKFAPFAMHAFRITSYEHPSHKKLTSEWPRRSRRHGCSTYSTSKTSNDRIRCRQTSREVWLERKNVSDHTAGERSNSSSRSYCS